jgi:hypothetical protein
MVPEKEHSGTFKNSKLFPENQRQMEHYGLLTSRKSLSGYAQVDFRMRWQVWIYRRYVEQCREKKRLAA